MSGSASRHSFVTTLTTIVQVLFNHFLIRQNWAYVVNNSDSIDFVVQRQKLSGFGALCRSPTQRVDLCRPLSISVDCCQSLSIAADRCWLLSIAIDCCRSLPITIDRCQWLSIEKGRHAELLLKNVTRRTRRRSMIKHHELLQWKR